MADDHHNCPGSWTWRYRAGCRVGDCTIVRPLGVGGMGEVYLARHPSLGPVALKAALPRTIRRPPALERFLEEASLTADLRHPNIVRALGLGEHGGVPHVLLTFVDGQTLRWHLNETALAPEAMLRIGHDVAEALAEVHRQGILHLDLKPSNVLVARDGSAHLTDFGIAARLRDGAAGLPDPAPSGSTVMGTPRYMAPEQWLGRPVSPAADVWGLGVMLYELVTRQQPFRWTTTHEYLARVTCCAPEPVHAGAIPALLTDLIYRCMDKAPDRRPAAETVAIELLKLRLGGLFAPTVQHADAATTTTSPLRWLRSDVTTVRPVPGLCTRTRLLSSSRPAIPAPC